MLGQDNYFPAAAAGAVAGSQQRFFLARRFFGDGF